MNTNNPLEKRINPTPGDDLELANEHWPPGIRLEIVERFISGEIEGDEADEVEELLSMDPTLYARVLRARNAFLEARSYAVLPDEGERPILTTGKRPGTTAPADPSSVVGHGSTILHVCFKYEMAASEPVDLAENVAGPPEVHDDSGKRVDARLTVRSSEQGDILIAVEGDKALVGQELRIRGSSTPVILKLEENRGRAFAITSLTETQYNEIVKESHGRPTCIWE